MSRLTTAKADRFEEKFRECCAEDRFLPLFQSRTTNSTIGNGLKDIFLCAFDKANAGQSGTNKINKQELYAILFTMGFPLGLIAKTLLNANLSPVRNAVIFYKEPVLDILKRRQLSVANGIEARNWRNGNEIRNFAENIIDYCLFAGGMPLVEKMIKSKDIEVFLTTYHNNQLVLPQQRNPFTGGVNRILNDVMNLRANSLQRTFPTSRRGQVRRTGLTTSRVAQATTQIPARPNASQGVTPSAIPQSQNISTPTPAQTPVRDIEFNHNIGVEIEIVISNEMQGGGSRSETALTNNLVREMRASKIDVQAVGYTHNTTSYWKITSDGSIDPAGVEVVSPILKGKRGLAELRKCIGAIRRAGGSVNASVGIHVHFGANGLTLEHWRNLLYNYAGFEPVINKTLYQTRRNSQWAKPISQIPDLTNKLDRSNDFDSLVRTVFGGDAYDYRGGSRYYAVNLLSYRRHGTVEFRQLQGSVEEDTIIYWIYFLHFLIEVSKRKRLSYFDDKQLRNITPVWLSTYMGNRSFDLSDDAKNFNAPKTRRQP